MLKTIIHILAFITSFVLLGLAIELDEDTVFGYFVFSLVIYLVLRYPINFIFKLLAKYTPIPCSLVDCALPNPEKNHKHFCPKCKTNYVSRFGKKFGGFGQRWEVAQKEEERNYVGTYGSFGELDKERRHIDRSKCFERRDKERRENELKQIKKRIGTNSVRYATLEEYVRWMKKYLESGKKPTHDYDSEFNRRDILVATSDLDVPDLFGVAAIDVIVPSGINIDNDGGHSRFFYMDNPEKATFAPMYKDVKELIK
ncbi:hypothetical protein HOD29_04990 [archaeon]|jgi:hypothetical protein|nr:hypothetical protein [archaeon]